MVIELPSTAIYLSQNISPCFKLFRISGTVSAPQQLTRATHSSVHERKIIHNLKLSNIGILSNSRWTTEKATPAFRANLALREHRVTLHPPVLRSSERSRDTHTAFDWLRWLAASSAVLLKVKRSMDTRSQSVRHSRNDAARLPHRAEVADNRFPLSKLRRGLQREPFVSDRAALHQKPVAHTASL